MLAAAFLAYHIDENKRGVASIVRQISHTEKRLAQQMDMPEKEGQLTAPVPLSMSVPKASATPLTPLYEVLWQREGCPPAIVILFRNDAGETSTEFLSNWHGRRTSSGMQGSWTLADNVLTILTRWKKSDLLKQHLFTASGTNPTIWKNTDPGNPVVLTDPPPWQRVTFFRPTNECDSTSCTQDEGFVHLSTPTNIL